MTTEPLDSGQCGGDPPCWEHLLDEEQDDVDQILVAPVLDRLSGDTEILGDRCDAPAGLE